MNNLLVAASRHLTAYKHPSAFLGLVPTSEFITGNDLAIAIGLDKGIAINETSPWLKFYDEVDGKTKYVSRQAIRHSISWDDLDAIGAVFGTVVVEILDKRYKVRLLEGANSNPTDMVHDTFDHPATHGSEWNRLLYRVSGKPFRDSRNTLASEGIEEGDWAQFSEVEMTTNYDALQGMVDGGTRCWCQESSIYEPGKRIVRGHFGVSFGGYVISSPGYALRGWRPVLELIG